MYHIAVTECTVGVLSIQSFFYLIHEKVTEALSGKREKTNIWVVHFLSQISVYL